MDPVLHDDGPAAVIAAAGSGKTQAAVRRAARLIGEGRPTLLLTFTQAAATELRARVFGLAGGAKFLASTYHGLGYQIVRRYSQLAGLGEGVTPITPAEEARLWRRLYAELWGRDLDPEERLRLNEAYRRYQRLRAEDRLEAFFGEVEALGLEVEAVRVLLEALKEEKARLGVAAFDDLIEAAIPVLESEAGRKWIEAHAQYVIVDEYQDTSRQQERMLWALAPGDAPNLMVIGDPNQAIYGWRGAGTDAFERFLARYPHAAVYPMRVNHRSTAAILRAAEAVISRLYQPGQESFYRLTPAREEGMPPEVRRPATPFEEARMIAREIRAAIEDGSEPGAFAVLGRSALSLSLVEGALGKLGVPVRLLGGMRLTERREVKTLLALIKGAVLKDDAAALEFLEEVPPSVGERTVSRIEEQAAGKAIADWLLEAKLSGFRASAREGLARTRTAFLLAQELLGQDDLAEGLRTLITAVFKELFPAYLERLARNGPGVERRLANLERLADLAAYLREEEPDLGVDEFVRQLALQDELEEDAVTLATVHASKGLEWPTVYVVSLVEGVFPLVGEGVDPSEERRLFYVAATRAKDRLILSAPRIGERGKMLMPSRFLHDVEEVLPQAA